MGVVGVGCTMRCVVVQCAMGRVFIKECNGGGRFVDPGVYVPGT